MTISDGLKYLIITLCGVVVLFALAAIFVPSFDDSKAMIMGGILATLVTIISTLATMSRVLTVKEKQEGKNGANGTNGPHGPH